MPRPCMPPRATRKVMTLHAPMAASYADRFLAPAIEAAQQWGCRWWLGTEDLPDLTLMVECHPEWAKRAPAESELAQFHALWAEGRRLEAQRLASDGGLPDYLR